MWKILSFIVLSLPLAMYADGVKLLEPIPGFIEQSAGGDLGQYLNGAYRLGIAITTGLAVIMIAVGGVEKMGESITKKKSGGEKVTNAIFGLLIALGSYLILNEIDPALIRFDLVTLLETINKE